MSFVLLETVIRRAPLGLRFLDLARGLAVTDGLSVSAYPLGGPSLRRVALCSPVSGVYGFRALPGLRGYEQNLLPASNWCSTPTDGGTPGGDALQDFAPIKSLVEANENGAAANFAVEVADRQGRFLPQVLQMCLHKEHLVEVPLFSAPVRPPTPGNGIVRGELRDNAANAPASWAIVTVSPAAGTTYIGVADARGMFAVSLPYASALPGSGGSTLDQLTWNLTIGVLYQPSAQRRVAGTNSAAPPDTRSILEQAAATLHDAGAAVGAVATIIRPIRFGADLIVQTGGAAQLLVEPA